MTGHSLGAGIAVLLTVLLRNEYPFVKCICFGTPGSVLDQQTCKGINLVHLIQKSLY